MSESTQIDLISKAANACLVAGSDVMLANRSINKMGELLSLLEKGQILQVNP